MSAIFTKPVVLVTFAPQDEITDGWVVIERPGLTTGNGVTFITGYHSSESASTVSGRRVLVPLHSVTSITEYDTVAEVWERRKPKRKRRK
jgi:hypothetical protein